MNKNEQRRQDKVIRTASIAIRVLKGEPVVQVAAVEKITVWRCYQLLNHAFRVAAHPSFTPTSGYPQSSSLRQKCKDKEYWLMQMHKVKLFRP